MNTFGTLFRLTTFGESHGPGIGGIIDGMPAGIPVDLDFIQSELNRRKPGQSALTTPRKENDCVELLSGVFDGRTTGCPIGFLVRNENQHSADYDNMRHVFRPSHADFTYETKYGIRDHRGGGRSSARETIARVVGGAFAKMVLKKRAFASRPLRNRWAGLLPTGITLLTTLRKLNATRCAAPMRKRRLKWANSLRK